MPTTTPESIDVVKSVGQIGQMFQLKLEERQSITNEVVSDESMSSYESHSNETIRNKRNKKSTPNDTNRTNVKRDGSMSAEVEEYEQKSDPNESTLSKGDEISRNISKVKQLKKDQVNLQELDIQYNHYPTCLF